MGLIQAAFLFALAGLAIPLIIHFTFRARPRTVDVGTTRFLRNIIERSRNRKRVMRWLLLSLRMVSIALLAFLFARPYLHATVEGAAERLLVVLVDDSASMRLRRDGRTLFDLAVEQTQQIIEAADKETQIEVAFFNEQVVPLQSLDDRDRERSRTRSEQMKERTASYAQTDYSAAIRWASDVCAQSSASDCQVHVFTDLQRSGLAWSDKVQGTLRAEVTIHDLGKEMVNNVAVTSATPDRVWVRPGDKIDVTATVQNSGPFTLDEAAVTLELRHGNRPIRLEQRLKLSPDAVEKIRFELPELAEGLWQGNVSLDAFDDLTFDNQRCLAIMSMPPLRVLIVDGDRRDLTYHDESYFVNLALRLAPQGERFDGSPFAPEVLFAPIGELPELSPYKVIILANHADFAQRDAARIAQFVHSGGGLIVSGGRNVTADNARQLAAAGLLPGVVGKNVAATELPYRLRKWSASHSIFQPFDDPQHGDLRTISFRGYTALAPDDDAASLATFQDGRPALVEKRIGEGRVLWFASTLDLEWSDMARSPLYVPLVHQLLGRLSGLNDGGPVRSKLVQGAEGPDALSKPGVFSHGQYYEVVNVNSQESEVDRCTIDDLINRFGLRRSESDDASAAGAGPARLQIHRDEIWHWIVVTLVAVAALEFFIANRATA